MYDPCQWYSNIRKFRFQGGVGDKQQDFPKLHFIVFLSTEQLLTLPLDIDTIVGTSESP